jgi:hypothetical protein
MPGATVLVRSTATLRVEMGLIWTVLAPVRLVAGAVRSDFGTYRTCGHSTATAA